MGQLAHGKPPGTLYGRSRAILAARSSNGAKAKLPPRQANCNARRNLLRRWCSATDGEQMPNVNPRVNVTVTREQHALLLELAELNGGSASGYLRQMLDQATPLLRATVPLLRATADEMNASREEVNGALADLLGAIRGVGMDVHPDLLDGLPEAPPRSSHAPQPSEDVRGRGAHSQPPYSNTGVSTSPTPPRSKGAKS